jgi:hypothetical protein
VVERERERTWEDRFLYFVFECSLCSSGWPGTCHLLASAFQVLGLQACTTIATNSIGFFLFVCFLREQSQKKKEHFNLEIFPYYCKFFLKRKGHTFKYFVFSRVSKSWLCISIYYLPSPNPFFGLRSDAGAGPRKHSPMQWEARQ